MSRKLQPGRRGTNPERLTAQQQLFIEAYFADRKMNAAHAARVAGYASTSTAAKLLDNPLVKNEIQKRLQKVFWEHQADRERILRELMAISFMNPQDLLDNEGAVIPLHKLPQEVARTISSMKTKTYETVGAKGETVKVTECNVSFHDKLTAVGLLMRHLGMMEPSVGNGSGEKAQIDWDDLVKPHALSSSEDDAEDPVERKILSYHDKPSIIVVEPEKKESK